MECEKHCYRAGSHSDNRKDLPVDPDELALFIDAARKHIEPWLSAVFQAEHLNLLIGSGFTAAIAALAGAPALGMSTVKFGTTYDSAMDAHATKAAKEMNRGTANIEDQFRSALAVLEGLLVIDPANATKVNDAIDAQMQSFSSLF